MTKISDIYSAREAMTEAVRRWVAGNNNGSGYEIEQDDLAAAEQILSAGNDKEVDVYILDGREVGVAESYGALWAVDL
jgi:hypothetical protein